MLLGLLGCASAEERRTGVVEDLQGSWEGETLRIRFADTGDFDARPLPSGQEVLGKFVVTGSKASRLDLSGTRSALDGSWAMELEGCPLRGAPRDLTLHREGQAPLVLHRVEARE